MEIHRKATTIYKETYMYVDLTCIFTWVPVSSRNFPVFWD